MPNHPLDDERLRELITDGTPPASDGDTVREIGGAHSQNTEALTDAAVADIEAEHGPKRKYSTDERPPEVVIRKRRFESYVALALVTGVAAFAWYRALHRPPPVPSDPVEFVAILSPLAAESPALTPEWDVVRGVSDSLTERGRAVRVGALLVEFERSWVRDDSSAQRSADAISALLVDQPDGVEVAGIFASGNVEARLPTTRRDLAPLVRIAPMGVGGWLQAARVAASSGDAGFFASTRSKESLRLLLEMPGVTPDVQTARDRLNELLARRGRPDFAAASGLLESLQRELAN
jgi:hypothetical protein